MQRLTISACPQPQRIVILGILMWQRPINDCFVSEAARGTPRGAFKQPPDYKVIFCFYSEFMKNNKIETHVKQKQSQCQINMAAI